MHIAIIGPANPEEFTADLDFEGEVPAGIGGIPVNALVRSLLDMGHKVSLFTASPNTAATWRAKGKCLSVVVVPYRPRAKHRALDFFRRERGLLAAEISVCNADIFHAHWTYEFALACIDANVGLLVVTAHDAPLTILRQTPDLYRLIRALMAIRARMSIRNLVAVSPYLVTSWRKDMIFRRPITMITNPMPALMVCDAGEPTHPIVLDVANASSLKNVKSLLRAFGKVRGKNPTLELRLIGQGLQRGGKLNAWAVNKKMETGVTFLGKLNRTALAREYAGATVFCHPSREESQGVSLVEAMIARLPIVAGQKSGAVAWTVFEGVGSVLVDINRPELIAQGIQEVLNGIDQAKSQAVALEILARKRYDSKRIAEEYVKEYERVIATRHHGWLSSNRP